MDRTATLFYLATPNYGGWPVFTAHLERTLAAAGWRAHLVKVGPRTESRRRPFGYGLGYQNVSLEAACSMARSGPSLVTACGRDHHDRLGPILRAGAALVIHDPTEMRGPLLEAARAAHAVVAIREANLPTLADAGIRARFIPHPYVRHFHGTDAAGWARRPRHAISLSRVDFDKHTETIAAANERLDSPRRILIRGDLNRLYAHHKLDAAHPRWREMYVGRFDRGFGEGAAIADGFRYLVDMSAIKGDGRGGTQYTFLEAWDAGCVLVVNRRWLEGSRGDSPLQEGGNCLAAADGAELFSILAAPIDGADSGGIPDIAARGRLALSAHSPMAVAARWAELLAAAPETVS